MSTQQNQRRTRRRPSPAILAAVIAAGATVFAAAVPITVELVRDGLSGQPASSPAPATGAPGPEATPTGAPGPAATATAASPDPGAAAPDVPGMRYLTDLPEVDGFVGWDHTPQMVAGNRHERVLTASPCWLNDNFDAAFVTSRQYTWLEATVGLADESVPAPLTFAVLVDGKPVFSTRVGLGRTRPVRVDVRTATRVAIQVSTTSTEQCHDNTFGVWIDPRLRR